MKGESLGAKLRQARKQRGWTQEQMAEKMYVSRQTISNWENDRSQADYVALRQLADLFEMDVAVLLGEFVPPPTMVVRAEETAVDELAPIVKKRKRWVFVTGVLAILLIGVALAVYSSSQIPRAGDLYSIEWFEQEIAIEEGVAYLDIYSRTPVVNATRGSPTATPMWNYQFIMKERNGVGLTIERLSLVTLRRNGQVIVDTRIQGQIDDMIGMAYIAEGEFRWFGETQPADNQTVGIGCVAEGTDNNGNAFCYRLYLPFENEYR